MIQIISLKKIIIPKRLIKTPPKQEKVNRYIQYYNTNGIFPKPLIISNNFILLDKYGIYIAALQLGLKQIETEIKTEFSQYEKSLIYSENNVKTKNKNIFSWIKNIKFKLLTLTNKINYIVVDCEFVENELFKSKKEVIQIGLIKLNSKFEMVDKLNIYVKPSFPINKSGLKKNRVSLIDKVNKSNTSFIQAIDIVNQWLLSNTSNIFMSWSLADMIILKSNCKYYNLKYKSIEAAICIDMQRIHYNTSLKKALFQTGIQVNKPLHDAMNDALYTTQYLQKIPFEKSYNYLIRYAM